MFWSPKSGDGGLGVLGVCKRVHTMRLLHLHSFLSQPPEWGHPWSIWGYHQDSWCWGSCTAAGWLGKSSSPANPGRASASAQLSTHPPPSLFLRIPPHTPVVHQLRAAGETAGLCCQGEDVFMSVSVEWSGGGAGPVTSLIHLNTCTHTHALFSSSSFGCTADVSQHFWN